MTTNEAIKHYGGIYRLSAELGIHPNAIKHWGERPPMGRQYELQVKTGGALVADGEPQHAIEKTGAAHAAG